MVAEIWASVILSFVDQLVAKKVSLITLTKIIGLIPLIIYFNSITQSCYVQYQSNNVSNS